MASSALAATGTTWPARGLPAVSVQEATVVALPIDSSAAPPFTAIDRCSRSVHLAIKEDMTAPSATAFLQEAAAAFSFRLTHMLTDRGACFTTGAFAKACSALGAQHRLTKPYTPQTNGMAERFNGSIEREVLTITVGSHCDLERLLKGYNARPQRLLRGRSPNDVVRSRLAEAPTRQPAPQAPRSQPHGGGQARGRKRQGGLTA